MKYQKNLVKNEQNFHKKNKILLLFNNKIRYKLMIIY